jgi:hypothetical protein
MLRPPSSVGTATSTPFAIRDHACPVFDFRFFGHLMAAALNPVKSSLVL